VLRALETIHGGKIAYDPCRCHVLEPLLTPGVMSFRAAPSVPKGVGRTLDEPRVKHLSHHDCPSRDSRASYCGYPLKSTSLAPPRLIRTKDLSTLLCTRRSQHEHVVPTSRTCAANHLAWVPSRSPDRLDCETQPNGVCGSVSTREREIHPPTDFWERYFPGTSERWHGRVTARSVPDPTRTRLQSAGHGT
jgi:hypothetical protein